MGRFIIIENMVFRVIIPVSILIYVILAVMYCILLVFLWSPSFIFSVFAGRKYMDIVYDWWEQRLPIIPPIQSKKLKL